MYYNKSMNYQTALLGLLSTYTAYTIVAPMITMPSEGDINKGGRVLAAVPVNVSTQVVDSFREIGYLYSAGTPEEEEEEPETPVTTPPATTPTTPPATTPTTPTTTPATTPTTPTTTPTTPPTTTPTTPPTTTPTPTTPTTPATPPTTSPFISISNTLKSMLYFKQKERILPLYGRRIHRGSDNWNYYVKAERVYGIRVPIYNQGRSCEDKNGCPELYDGDTIYLKELDQSFTAKIYDNGYRYIPYLY